MKLRAFSRTIEALQAASMDDDTWAEVWPRIYRLLDETRVVVGIHQGGGSVPWLGFHGFEPEAMDSIKADFSAESAADFLAWSQKLSGRRHLSNLDVYSVRDLERHPVYGEAARRFDIWDVRASSVFGARGRNYLFAAALERGRGRFSDEQMLMLDLLIPHMEKAFAAREQRLLIETERDTGLATLDRMACALVTVSEDASVVWMNRAAADYLDRDGPLQCRNGRLRARAQDADARLRAAIGDALEPAGGAKTLLLFEGVGEDAFCHCWITALATGSEPYALIAVNDPRAAAQRIRNAGMVYRLSPAQQRLAALLLDGFTLVGAAEKLEISINTARTQLHRMFDKTGTRSQAGLVRALLTALPPFGE